MADSNDTKDDPVGQLDEVVDGRVARRQRNIDAVLDVVLEMFAEDAMFPTIEQAAVRSGLSLRSLYRYFADPGELLEAVIERSREQTALLSRLHSIGEGPFEDRLAEFVEMRVRVYEARSSVFRATVVNAARHERVRDELARSRDDMREQFELQFAPELAERKGADRESLLAAGDVVCQLHSINYLRRHRELSAKEVESILATTLRSLFQ